MDNQDQSQNFSSQGFMPAKKPFVLATKHIIIFIAVLSTLSLGTTSFLIFANKKEKPVNLNVKENIATVPSAKVLPTQKLLPTVTATPAPTLAPLLLSSTATWSAYVSTKYKYSLKYPPDWTAKITTQSDPKILEYVVFNPKTATAAGTLTITLSYGTRTYQEALALDPQSGEIITVASVSATKKNQLDSDGNKSINIIIPVGSNNTIVINGKNPYKSTLDLMLTTVSLK